MGADSFFQAVGRLDVLKKVESPRRRDLHNVLRLLNGDEELTWYFYGKNERGALSEGWLELLDGAGEFEGLGKKEAGIVQRVKAIYLVDCADKKPEEVLEVIKRVNAKDVAIQGILTDAMLKMPEELAARGVPVVLEYLRGREYKAWYPVGRKGAEFMVRLGASHAKEALELGRGLLEVWRPGEKEAGVFETIRSRFATREYKELVFEFYSKVWEVWPVEAVRVLVDIYDKCLEEYNKEEGYDTSEYLGVRVEDLENIERLNYNTHAIIVKAICEAGRAVVKKEPEQIGQLLEDMERRDKGIFQRAEMYLLRFVQAGTQTERINKLVAEKKFIKNALYRYEHRRLLDEKFEEVWKETKEAFVGWVAEEKVGEERRKEIAEWCEKNDKALPDFDKMENRRKAEELYLVRDSFRELFEQYKKAAGVEDDSAVAPRRMVSEVRHVSAMEGTPVSLEAMGKMSVGEVLDYVSDPKNYEGKKKPGEWRAPGDALRATFKEDVKKRPLEYLTKGKQKLAGLPAETLSGFFYGVSDTVRDGSFAKGGWGEVMELAHSVVEANRKEEAYRSCLSGMLSALREGFSERENRIEFDEKRIREFWAIIEPLVHFPVGDASGLGEEGDPVQRLCNVVPAQALELTVLVGATCKREFEAVYEEYLKGERRGCYEYVLSNVTEVGVHCVFGLYFARLYWLDGEWVEERLCEIFSQEMWDAVWGTYVSWGRPSEDGFRLLVDGGMYARAVGLLGRGNKFRFGKDPEEGLVEHLMVGFFNGWIGYESDLMRQFFKTASADLRGKAARFLTSGFKQINDEARAEEKQKVAGRMKEYWQKRLAAIKEKPAENREEAVELTGWVEDSVLEAKETLELLKETLDLSGGKIGKMKEAHDFVKGVTALGKGNEWCALQCLEKAAADDSMHWAWEGIQQPLVAFLEGMAKLPGKVRSEAAKVADLYGRYNPEKFRPVWDKLRK